MASVENTAIFAPAPTLERATSYVLGADPKGKNFLYTNSKGVIIRDIENPKNCDVYVEHAHPVLTAQYAPSGFYICSGDAIGKIRIWDTMNKEHIIKNEFRPLSAPIRDISWGPESKRIALCGKGTEKLAAVILADSGNNVGDLSGAAKRANSISYKPNRPYRLAIGDDDFQVLVYEGPPFKIKHTLLNHSRFVNSVRYSPDGKYLATASSDGHVFLYDGKSTELLGQLGDEEKGAHAGGVYSISWSPDGKELLTVSADKSAKIWDVEARKEVFQIIMGKRVEDQQLASLWMGKHLLSVSYAGDINYLSREDPSKPIKVLRGHSKPITQVIALPGGYHVTGDSAGVMLKWNTESGYADAFTGQGHTGKISALIYDDVNKKIISASWDDKVKFTCAVTLDFSAATTISLESQPRSMFLVDNGYLALNCHKAVVLYKDQKKVCEIRHSEEFCPTGFAAHGTTVAVEAPENMVKIYQIEHDSLVDTGITFKARVGATVMSFSPDGSKLSVGTGGKYIQIHQVADGYKSNDLIGHHMPPSTVAWSPDSQKLASAGIDASFRVWNIATRKKGDVQNAHKSAQVTSITWLDDNRLLTVGDDCLTKEWVVTW